MSAPITIHLELTLDEYTLILSAFLEKYAKNKDLLVHVATIMALPALPGLGEKMTVATNQGSELMAREEHLS